MVDAYNDFLAAKSSKDLKKSYDSFANLFNQILLSWKERANTFSKSQDDLKSLYFSKPEDFEKYFFECFLVKKLISEFDELIDNVFAGFSTDVKDSLKDAKKQLEMVHQNHELYNLTFIEDWFLDMKLAA